MMAKGGGRDRYVWNSEGSSADGGKLVFGIIDISLTPCDILSASPTPVPTTPHERVRFVRCGMDL